MDKYLQERDEMNERYDAPRFRKLKYAALAVMAVGVILLLCIAFGIETIPPIAMLLMRGVVGLCAITFVGLVTIITYSANKEHITNRRNNSC